MSHKKLVCRAIATTAVAVAVGSTIAAPTAHANIPMCPTDSQCFYTYYAEPALLTVVGDTLVDCDRTWHTRGTVTRHIRLTHSPCY